MSKLIAVCGSPESGKTTLGLKLAQELYFTKKTSVLFLSVDLNVPIMQHSIIFGGVDSADYGIYLSSL